MSEPVLRRTVSALRALTVQSAARCGLIAALTVLGAAIPLAHAAQEAGTTPSIISPLAEHNLLLDVVNAGARLIAVGDRGHILYSDDQGQSWTQAQVPTQQMLTAVYFASPEKGWAVGHDAQILATVDGGKTWIRQYQNLELEAPLLDIWFRNEQEGFAVGAYGAFLHTTDGGKSWEDVKDLLDNEDDYHLNSIAAIKESGLFIVGEQGAMFRSADWGQHWERLQGPYEGSLFGVMSNGVPAGVLAYGLRGHLFRSSDFGSHWERIPLKGANGPLEASIAGGSVLADGSLVLVGNAGTVLRSSDSGRSFSVFNRSDRLALSSACGNGDGQLILAGQNGVLRASATGSSLKQQ